MKKSLDTEPAGKEIILCRKSNLRYSILEGSRFSPTMDSAISDRVCTGKPCNRFTALCLNREIADISAFGMLYHSSEP